MDYTSICQHLTRNALSVFSPCLLLASVGCSGPAESEDTTAELSQGLSGSAVFVYFSDGRTASNVVVTVEGKDQATGANYSDWEAVGGSLPPPSVSPRKLSWMAWDDGPSDRLDEFYFIDNPLSDPYSMFRIDDMSTGYFTKMRVRVRATINGYCHEDWEDIDWTTRPELYFNGNGASWDGSCFRGNMLRGYP